MTIDWWTLGIQTINVLILIWILGRFFWRPLAAMIDQRRATARRMLDDADAARAQAADALAAVERTRAGFAQERDAILAAAQATAEREHAARLDAATREAEALRAAARADIARETAAIDKAWRDRAGQLAVTIAQRLASRLDGPAVQAAFLDWLLREVRALPDAIRASAITGTAPGGTATGAADGAPLAVLTAAPLDAAEQDRYRALIAQAFGGASGTEDRRPAITFASDPALIAGVEIHGPHLVVSNSWRADLSQILTELTHDP